MTFNSGPGDWRTVAFVQAVTCYLLYFRILLLPTPTHHRTTMVRYRREERSGTGYPERHMTVAPPAGADAVVTPLRRRGNGR